MTWQTPDNTPDDETEVTVLTNDGEMLYIYWGDGADYMWFLANCDLWCVMPSLPSDRWDDLLEEAS